MKFFPFYRREGVWVALLSIYALGTILVALPSWTLESMPPDERVSDNLRCRRESNHSNSALPPTRVIVNLVVDSGIGPLKRLCSSLASADYLGDTNITLEFHLGAQPSEEIVRFVSEFAWANGEKIVHARITRAQPMAVVLETWFPASQNEYSLLLGGDMEVSPLFYRNIREILEAFTRAGAPTSVLGISLSTPKQHSPGLLIGDRPAMLSDRRKRDISHFGILYFPQPWREYLRAGRTRKESGYSAMLPGPGTSSRSPSFLRAGGKHIRELGPSAIFESLCQNEKNTRSLRRYLIYPTTRPGQYSLGVEKGAAAVPFCAVAVRMVRTRLQFHSSSETTTATKNRVPFSGAAVVSTMLTERNHGSPPPRIIINVLVNNRFESLRRLCSSLASADYMGSTDVILEFHLEAHQSEEIVRFVDEFAWANGKKIVHARVVRGGLISVVAESWFPVSANEFSLLLEDDIEVSPLFYRYIQGTLDAYFRAGAPASVFGISLYTPRVIETRAASTNSPVNHRRFDPQYLIRNMSKGRLNRHR